jgi:hypothetical protein
MLVKVINLNYDVASLLLPLIVEEILIERDNISDSDHFVRVLDALRLVDHFIFFKFLFHSMLREVNRYLAGAILNLNFKHRRRGLPTNIFAPPHSEI